MQISPLHLAIAATGGVLIYAALADLSPAAALKELTSGRPPKPIPSLSSSLGTTKSLQPRSDIGSANALVKAAEAYMGVPYKWGGASRAGLDCSGLVVVAFQDAYGVTPPRSTYGQEVWKQLARVTRDDLRAGDLVFWPGHVAIYVGAYQVIHAPRPGKAVRFEHIDSAGPVGQKTPTSYQRYKGGTAQKASV